ncbi:phosphoribosyltransferase [Natronorubrum halalkaliphilum]|nr:phosphoribosyltransferase family protein [Natronorubrum halalkaliphilum]
MASTRQFADRTDAGERLGEALLERGIHAELVLAIPRGGLPLGRAVADALEAPLDVVVAKKIGAPGNPEYAVGAVASDGSVWRNERAISGTRTDEGYFQERRETEAENARQKAARYRGGRSAPELTDKTVVVVDDGVATGSTVRACLSQLQQSDATRIVLAVPVGPPDTIADLEAQVDAVVCLETPPGFSGVGQFYADFGQVSDEDAMAYLES